MQWTVDFPWPIPFIRGSIFGNEILLKIPKLSFHDITIQYNIYIHVERLFTMTRVQGATSQKCFPKSQALRRQIGRNFEEAQGAAAKRSLDTFYISSPFSWIFAKF
jgi:hypothetical protein